MKKIQAMVLIGLVILLGILSPTFAADVGVKYSGPSSQGDIIYYAPTNALTNVHFTATGFKIVTYSPDTAQPTVTPARKTVTYAGPTNPIVTLSLGTVLMTNLVYDTSSGASSSNILLVVTSATATATIPFGSSDLMTNVTVTLP